MKIGEFREKNRLSINTIRHYMDLGLINPEKRGGQYFFDELCQKDLEQILELKGMGFSLNKIKTIILYENFGKFTDYERNAYYQSIYVEKFKEVEQEIRTLAEIKDKLKSKMDDLLSKSEELSSIMGIDLSILNMLKCAKCTGSLILEDGIINRNQMMDGRLTCSCGEEYHIESGILSVGKPCESTFELLLEDYINETDSAYLENIHKAGEWSKRKLIELDLTDKVILELGTGLGFFLRNIYSHLPEDCLYIAVDRNIESQKFLKGVLEKSGLKRNILFVCADFLDVPLKNNAVDIVIDQSGTSNYSFENEDFLLHDLSNLLKPECYLLGTFIGFKNFSNKSKIDTRFRDNFILKNIKENIHLLKFNLLDERLSEDITRGGQYENFFVQGEEVYTYSFFGKRSG